MSDKPDFGGQFRSRPSPFPRVYMGGTAMSCGDHELLPKRHRWGPWREIKLHIGKGWERTCRTCALVDDMRFTKPPRKDLS